MTHIAKRNIAKCDDESSSHKLLLLKKGYVS